MGLALGVSAWAGVDRWTAVGQWDSPNGHRLRYYTVVNPSNPDIWFLAASAWSYNDMIYTSNNGGKSWYIAQENVIWPSDDINKSILEIIYSHGNPNTMYILVGPLSYLSTGDIFKSDDNGRHWTQQTTDQKLRGISVHPQNSNVLYAYSETQNSLVKSTDGGSTLVKIGAILGGEEFDRIVIDQFNPASVYMITDKATRRSLDSGMTWQVIDSTALGIPLDVTNFNVAVARDGITAYKIEYKKRGYSETFSVSRDKGNSWQTKTLPQVWSGGDIMILLDVIPDPIKAGTVYVTARHDWNTSSDYALDHFAILVSTDYGDTWQVARQAIVPVSYYRKEGRKENFMVQQIIKVDPFDSRIYYNLNYIYSEQSSYYEVRKSTDEGDTWQSVSQSQLPSSVDRLAVSHTTPHALYAYGEAGGIYRSTDGGATWTQSFKTSTYTYKRGKAGYFIDISGDPHIYLLDGTCVESFFGACNKWGNIQAVTSNDNGQTWQNVGGLDDVLPGTQIKYTEVNSMSGSGATRYATTQKGIYRSADSGATWAQFSNAGLPFAETPVYEVRIDPNNSAVLYADTAAGTFVYGKNSPPNVNSVEVQGNAVTGGPVKLAVYGNYLDVNPLTLSLQDCANPTVLPGGDDMSRYFQCQLGATVGAKAGTIKDTSGQVLNSFTVQAVPPGPKVSSVTPKNTPIVGQTVTFALAGEYLTASLRFDLPECLNLQEVAGGTATLRQYTCLLGGAAGNRNGTIKNANGATLYQFSVAVLEPKVTGVTPLTMVAGEIAEFTVRGEALPDNLSIWIGYCADPHYVGGDESARRFRCTVIGLAGSEQEGRVLNARAENIFPFTVKITDTQSASQCALYNPAAAPQVSLPCVKVGQEVYSAGMNIVPAPGLRFEVDMNSLKPAAVTPSADCAVFPHNGGLRLNCVEVEGIKFWAELGLVPGAPGVQFDLTGADVK